VLDAGGQVLGVLEDHDLVSAETRTPFVLRRQIDRAGSQSGVVEAAARLRPTAVALHRAGADSEQVGAVWSVVVDALTRRLLDLALLEFAAPPPFTWLALGSLARREAVPSSDVDSALSWPPQSDGPAQRAMMQSVAALVGAGLSACGLRADAHQVSAADPLFARPLAGWQQVARGLLDDPAQPKALLLASVLVDNRAVWGGEFAHAIAEAFVSPSAQRDLLLRMLARDALAHRPPIGFLHDFVVESGGARRGLLDLKRGGLLPIVDLARWAGLAAGVLGASTRERLRAAGASGSLRSDEAATLIEAFEVVSQVRIDHQIDQLEGGREPDDFIRPGSLSSIVRAQLKEAFRALASVQRGVHAELQLGAR
jgi:CBS domain-containing protein